MTDQTLLQTITTVEDVVLVEDASDDEEISDTQVTVKDPTFLITIEDCATYPTIVVNTEEALAIDEYPQVEATSPPIATPRKDEDLACPSMYPPSPLSTRTRRRRKSYDRSSLRQSVRLA
jgi:hypothetical protein